MQHAKSCFRGVLSAKRTAIYASIYKKIEEEKCAIHNALKKCMQFRLDYMWTHDDSTARMMVDLSLFTLLERHKAMRDSLCTLRNIPSKLNSCCEISMIDANSSLSISCYSWQTSDHCSMFLSLLVTSFFFYRNTLRKPLKLNKVRQPGVEHWAGAPWPTSGRPLHREPLRLLVTSWFPSSFFLLVLFAF